MGVELLGKNVRVRIDLERSNNSVLYISNVMVLPNQGMKNPINGLCGSNFKNEFKLIFSGMLKIMIFFSFKLNIIIILLIS